MGRSEGGEHGRGEPEAAGGGARQGRPRLRSAGLSTTTPEVCATPRHARGRAPDAGAGSAGSRRDLPRSRRRSRASPPPLNARARRTPSRTQQQRIDETAGARHREARGRFGPRGWRGQPDARVEEDAAEARHALGEQRRARRTSGSSSSSVSRGSSRCARDAHPSPRRRAPSLLPPPIPQGILNSLPVVGLCCATLLHVALAFGDRDERRDQGRAVLPHLARARPRVWRRRRAAHRRPSPARCTSARRDLLMSFPGLEICNDIDASRSASARCRS